MALSLFFSTLYCFAAICGLVAIVITSDPVLSGGFIFGGMVIYSVSRYIEPAVCKRSRHYKPTPNAAPRYHSEYANLVIHPEAQRTGVFNQTGIKKDAA